MEFEIFSEKLVLFHILLAFSERLFHIDFYSFAGTRLIISHNIAAPSFVLNISANISGLKVFQTFKIVFVKHLNLFNHILFS